MNPAQTPRQVAKGTQASVAAKSEREREREGSATLAFLLPSVMVLKEKGRRVRAEEEQRSGNFVLSSDSPNPRPHDMGPTNPLIMTGLRRHPSPQALLNLCG